MVVKIERFIYETRLHRHMDPIGNIYRLLFDPPCDVTLGSEQPRIRSLRSAYDVRQNARKQLTATVSGFVRAKDEYAAVYHTIASQIPLQGPEAARIMQIRMDLHAPYVADVLTYLDTHFDNKQPLVQHFQKLSHPEMKRQLALYLAGQSHHLFAQQVTGEGAGYLLSVPLLIDAFSYQHPVDCLKSAAEVARTFFIDITLSDIIDGTFTGEEVKSRWLRLLNGPVVD